MKKLIIQLPVLSIIYFISWMIGMMAGFTLFPADMPNAESRFDFNILVVSVLHAGILWVFLRYAKIGGWPLFVVLTLVSFGLTFFITQIETLWFNDTIQMDLQVLKALVLGGFVCSLIFSAAALTVAGKRKAEETFRHQASAWTTDFILRWTILIVLVWPMIYFLAGYFIAWQFTDLRVFYSGSTELKSFADMMKINIDDGLYTFQVFRSFIWIGIAYLIHRSLHGHSSRTQMLITGGLFAFLGSSQLLLQNPMMTPTVRYVHLAETFISTFVWGMILGYAFTKSIRANRISTETVNA